MKVLPVALCLLGCFGAVALMAAPTRSKRFNFETYEKRPLEWFASAPARAIADNLLLYQDASGGWPKNRDMTITPAEEAARRRVSEDETKPTFDNDATHSQLQFLARVITAGGGEERHRTAFFRGLDYTLAAQYPNGGWPQFYPLIRGYYSHITFNDDAMIGVMEVLHGVARGEAPFAFVDAVRRERARAAVARGVDCILKCQVVQDGKRTIWGAQHDVQTFAPVAARAFEPASLCGGESARIVTFLMSLPDPSPAVVDAVEGAVAWFRANSISGLEYKFVPADDLPGGFDHVVQPKADAEPLWARFYELGTNRPIFIGRDAVIRYAVEEIEHERRIGYAWYVASPRRVLGQEYPAWKQRLNAFTLANTERKLRAQFPQIRRPAVALPGNFLAREDIIYATRGREKLQLDVYRIAANAPRPAVLIVHGGGWETGSRQMERPLAQALAVRGYVAVPVSYRLGAAGRFPAALHDLKAAVAWLRAHHEEFGIDPTRVAMVGASAGGQLAALVGATNGLEEFNAPLAPPAASIVQAVVDIDGLADFTGAELVAQQERDPSAPVRFLGGKFSAVPGVWRAASAITHVGPQSAPTLFINSTAPTPLLPGREAMRDLLHAAGVASELVVIPDTPHPFWLFEPWFTPVVEHIDGFLLQQLKSMPANHR